MINVFRVLLVVAFLENMNFSDLAPFLLDIWAKSNNFSKWQIKGRRKLY